MQKLWNTCAICIEKSGNAEIPYRDCRMQKSLIEGTESLATSAKVDPQDFI